VKVTEQDVEALLTEAASELRDDEVRLRVMAKIKPRTVRLKGLSVEEVKNALNEAFEGYRADLPDDELQKMIDEATQEVDGVLADGTFRYHFRGKELLRATFSKLNLSQISFERFTYGLANQCRELPEVKSMLKEVFDTLDQLAAESIVTQQVTGSTGQT
jgi:hypothetical protein